MDIYSLGSILYELINNESFPEFTCGPLKLKYDRIKTIQFSKHKNNKFKLRTECNSEQLKCLLESLLNPNDIERPTIDQIISIDFINQSCLKYIDSQND
jgi:serine/threonine protein kinase